LRLLTPTRLAWVVLLICLVDVFHSVNVNSCSDVAKIKRTIVFRKKKAIFTCIRNIDTIQGSPSRLNSRFYHPVRDMHHYVFPLSPQRISLTKVQ
jgi:hypothetical protein